MRIPFNHRLRLVDGLQMRHAPPFEADAGGDDLCSIHASYL
jgi:hypothetical protein